MTDRCPICDSPLATDDDTRRAMSDDERAGMCWSFGGRCLREPADWRARALAAEAERDRIAATLHVYEANHGSRCDAEQERLATIAESAQVALRDRSIDALTARVATLTAALDVEVDLCTEALVTVASLSADRDSWRRWAEILDFVAEEAAVRA